MKNMEKTINQRIADTGIFVFSYNPQTQLFTYSRPFTVEEAKLVADETNQVIASQYGNTNGLRGGLQARNNELINMNTLKGILANRALMRRTNNHQWLPTIKEGIQLQAQGLFSFGVLIDFGLALYDNKNPDEEIAQVLSMTAKEKGYAAPVLASFKSLDLAEGGKRYGVTPQIVSVDGLTFWDEAKELLDKNSFYKGNSGVRGLYRHWGGAWDALWYDGLDLFGDGCRVGRFSAEGSAKKLEEEALGTFAPIRQSLDSVLNLTHYSQGH